MAEPSDISRWDIGSIGHVQVIVNPASGRGRQVLVTLNDAFQGTGIDWDVSVTKGPGDGRRLTEEALRAGADVIAVWGGDGTLMEAASAMAGSATPLAILPGGTANVMAHELGIPGDLAAACELVSRGPCRVRPVDLGRLNEAAYFLLRIGIGFEAEMVEAADRQMKDRLGVLAYSISGIRLLHDPPQAHYQMWLDGQVVEADGAGCVIANSGNFGLGDLRLSPAIDVSDGLLDVLILRRVDPAAVLSLAANVIRHGEDDIALEHWQARDIEVVTDPPQKVTWDGESLAPLPLHVRVVPHALRVVVPAPAEP